MNIVCSLFLKDLGDGGSGVVQSAWAVLGLLACECTDRAAIDRGVKFIMDKQVCIALALV